MTAAVVDELIQSARVLIVAGLGGVGKTTLSASLAARAAIKFQRRALVITIDPARRLADALGAGNFDAAGLEDPVLVPVPGDGRLWAKTVDMSTSWDRLVRASAPDATTADELLDNKLYRSLTQRFVQSHDYIALDHLADLAADDKYDLVVVDTPPSVHVLGILDAPDQMVELFDSRLLTWLTASQQSRVAAAMSKPFSVFAERVLGQKFLTDISEFFVLFSALRPSFTARIEEVRFRLASPGTRFVTIATPEPASETAIASLTEELDARGYHPSLRIQNRAWPDMSDLPWSLVSQIEDSSLAEALHGVHRQVGFTAALAGRVPVARVEYRSAGFSSVDELAAVFDSLDNK